MGEVLTRICRRVFPSQHLPRVAVGVPAAFSALAIASYERPALDQGQEALQAGALEMLGALALVPDELQEPPILDRGIRLDLRLLGGDAQAVACQVLR
jgi:hypothetical protein